MARRRVGPQIEERIEVLGLPAEWSWNADRDPGAGALAAPQPDCYRPGPEVMYLKLEPFPACLFMIE